MAATSTTETWDAAWTLTMRSKRKELTDNFFDAYPTLDMFRSGGALVTDNGGKEIQADILYAGNSAQYFSGYDVLNTDAVDGITAAFYPFRYAAVPITINFTEEQENRKREAAMSLLEAKTRQSMLTLRDQINSSLYSAQTGKAPLGFQDVIADAPGTTPTTLGGITVSGNSWWQNKANNATADTSFKTIVNTNFYEGMIRMSTLWNDVSEGNEQPTNIFTTNSIYADFEEIFEGTGYQRLSGKDSPGVDGRLPSFRGIPVQYDRDCGTGRMYFLNTNYLKLHMQAGMNFSKTPFKENANQLAKVAFITVGLQVVTNNRRRQGVIYNLND
tara:strand:- start:3600 stop:4589 length:990 start_codon:yes stop_codon:yes gene_type:complete